MPADPIDPGAMPLAQLVLTNPQIQALVASVETHSGSIRVEKLSEGYARVVLLGPEGDAISEQLLFPA
jgi:hypothetical protein